MYNPRITCKNTKHYQLTIVLSCWRLSSFTEKGESYFSHHETTLSTLISLIDRCKETAVIAGKLKMASHFLTWKACSNTSVWKIEISAAGAWVIEWCVLRNKDQQRKLADGLRPKGSRAIWSPLRKLKTLWQTRRKRRRRLSTRWWVLSTGMYRFFVCEKMVKCMIGRGITFVVLFNIWINPRCFKSMHSPSTWMLQSDSDRQIYYINNKNKWL